MKIMFITTSKTKTFIYKIAKVLKKYNAYNFISYDNAVYYTYDDETIALKEWGNLIKSLPSTKKLKEDWCGGPTKGFDYIPVILYKSLEIRLLNNN